MQFLRTRASLVAVLRAHVYEKYSGLLNAAVTGALPVLNFSGCLCLRSFDGALMTMQRICCCSPAFLTRWAAFSQKEGGQRSRRLFQPTELGWAAGLHEEGQAKKKESFSFVKATRRRKEASAGTVTFSAPLPTPQSREQGLELPKPLAALQT